MLILNYDMSAAYHLFIFTLCEPSFENFNFTRERWARKKKIDNFQLCELCGRLVYSRQLADHRAVCGADLSNEDHKCAFTQDGVLHALVVEKNNEIFQVRQIDLSKG